MTRTPTDESSADPAPGGVLCRFGEIFLKGANRAFFEETLRHNIRQALSGLPSARVHTPRGRIMVDVMPGDVTEACARLERVFGLVSISPATRVEPDITAIGNAALGAVQDELARDRAARRSFRIEARRSDKTFALTSYEIAHRVGAQIQSATGLPVDLENPALTVGIEVGATAANVFTRIIPAPGGLPVGSSGRALLLLSGGIDSPVAGWLAAKRGLALDALYFHSPPFIGEKSKDKVVALARTLATRWQAVRSLYVAPFTDVQRRLREAGKPALAVVLYRRMMMRVADDVADRIGAGALVTGENLGQVASQTVRNLATIQAAARHLVLRPLLTYDKSETTTLARRIGTYDLSTLPYDDCCSLFVPPHPATGARVVDVEPAEAKLDVDAEAAAVSAAAEEIRL
jgi:thiamine biosynthesis protein ThiI